MKIKSFEKLKLNMATKLLDDILQVTHQIYITDLDINMDYEEYCKMVKLKAIEMKSN